MEFAGMTLNGILADTRSGFHYLPLPDSSVAIVGPNGAGKTSLIKGLQRCIQGVALGKGDSTLIHMDLLLPLNLEAWLESHPDPGIIKTIRNMLVSRESATWIKPDYPVKNDQYINFLKDIWRESVTDIEFEWIRRMERSESKPSSDSYLNETVQKHELWKSYIKVPFDQVPSDYEKYGELYLNEYKVNENSRKEIYNPEITGFNFSITPVGNERTPQWNIELIVKVSQEDLTFENPFTEIAQMLTWPKSLSESIKYQGQFGFGASGTNGLNGNPFMDEFLNQYVRFINDEAWFGINLGVTQNTLGFNFINPDEIEWDSVRHAAIELIDDSITFVKGGWSKLGFRLNNQSGQTFQTRVVGNQEGVVPIDENLSFTKEFDELLKKYSDMASDYFNSFILGAPRIEFVTNQNHYWITRGLLEIQIRDGYMIYRLEDLSIAQQRWAKISLLLTSYQYSNLALFVDEPERGIQRKIESTLLDIFDNLDVGATSLPRFFATHSAEIISNCSTVIQISKDPDGLRNIRRVVGSIYPLLQEIDISEEEFFQSKKLLVLTEGIMDKAMLDGFAFDRFQKEGIEVINGFGLESWSSYFDSQYLRKASGPKVVFWADSLDMRKLAELMQRVQDERIENKGLVHFLSENIRGVVKESWSKDQFDIVVAIIAESIQSKDSKVLIESTGDYDCIMWVSPQILGLPAGVTWPSLIEELNGQPRTALRESRGKRFKRLVKVKLKSAGIQDGLNIKRLKVLCQELELSGQIPEEVEQLINRIIKFAKE
jgi:hypothetical protein